MKVVVRVIACLLVSLIAIPSTLDPALAAGDATPGSVRIVVLESFAKQPIPRVDVKLDADDHEYEGFTDANGVVTFGAVLPGQYGLSVFEPNYAFPKDDVVTVAAGSATSLTIVGTRTTPRKIGTVRAKSTPPPNAAHTIAPDDAAAQIAGNVASAVSSLPSLGRDGFGNLTIHNQGAGLTTATVNGAPLFPSGSATQLNLFSSDAFSSASVDPTGALGAPGGGLNFTTVTPTIDWAGLAEQRYASFGSSASNVQMRGTTGHVGLAVTHSVTDTVSPIDGLNYLDTSGIFSSHDGTVINETDIATARYGFNVNHVGTLDAGRISSTTPLTCRFQSGPIPCGYGPDNGASQTLQFVQYRDQQQFNRGSLSLNLFSSQLRNDSENGAQTIEGTNVGFAGTSIVNRIGGEASFTYPVTTHAFAVLSLRATRDAAASATDLAQRIALPPTVTSLTEADLKLPLISRPRFDLNVKGGVNHGYGVTRPIDGLDASYRLTSRDFLTTSYSNGAVPGETYAFNGVSPAQTVQPECFGGRAVVGGPQFVGAAGSTASARAGIDHQGNGFAVNLDAFRDQTTNATVTGAIPGTALSGVVLPPGFYAQAAQTASLECNATIGLSPLSTYFTTVASVGKLVSDGLDAGVHVNLGTRADLSATYALARARAFGASALFVPGSNVTSGAQLPGRPIAQYRVNGKAALSRSTTLLVAATGTSGNNPYAQHPFVSLDAGVRFRAGNADVVAGVQNIGDVHGDTFTRFDPFPTLAQPFAPRTYSIRVRLGLGRLNIDKAESLSQPVADLNGFSFNPLPFEPKPAKGWLATTTDSPFCGPEKIAAAKRYQDALAHYVEQALSDPTVAPLHFDAMTVSRVPGFLPATFRIEFDIRRLRAVAPFTACTAIHFGTYDEAKKLGLYAPGWRERAASHGFLIYYSNTAGVYFSPNPINPDAGQRTMGAPGFSKRRGDERFAIDETSCPAPSRESAREAIAALHTYIDAFYAGRHPSVPDGFAISIHTAKSEDWLEIKAQNFEFGNLLSDCLNVPFVTPDQVAAHGLGVANFPSISYAAGVGFYFGVVMEAPSKK